MRPPLSSNDTPNLGVVKVQTYDGAAPPAPVVKKSMVQWRTRVPRFRKRASAVKFETRGSSRPQRVDWLLDRPPIVFPHWLDLVGFLCVRAPVRSYVRCWLDGA